MPVMQPRLVTGGQGAFDLAQRHRVHLHTVRAHQAQDVGVGVGLLGKAHHIKPTQGSDLAQDGGGVVHPQRGAMGAGQCGQRGGANGFMAR